MKYYIKSSQSPIKSIEIAKDLSEITFSGDVKKIKELLSFTSRVYVRSYINDQVKLSGLGGRLIALPEVFKLINNHPSIYGGIHSLRFILVQIRSMIDEQYDQILQDINEVSAELDHDFHWDQVHFESLLLFNPAILPEEKRIVFPGDVECFKERIVAYKSDNPKFTRSEFVSPLNQEYRFALISEQEYPRGHYKDVEYGHYMTCFITSKETSTDTPLIWTFLKAGPISMRLATDKELKYLQAAFELQQGRFDTFWDITKKAIQNELERHKIAKTPSTADQTQDELTTDCVTGASSTQAACSSSVESPLPQSVAALATDFSELCITARPSYVPGFSSKPSPKPRSSKNHHKPRHRKRAGQRRR